MPEFVKISKTGFFDGIDPERYHGDLATLPALNAGGAIEIMDTCPAKFWTNSYLNPEPIEDEETDTGKFAIGSAIHLALLELDQWDSRVVVFPVKTWQGAVNNDRKAVEAQGMIALKEKDARKIGRMRQALVDSGLYDKWIRKGAKERTMVYFMEAAGIALKIRCDVIDQSPDRLVVVDLKSTDSAAPHSWLWRVENMRLYQRETFYRSVIRQVLGREVSQYVHLVIETKPPYLAKAYEIGPMSLARGPALNAAAVARFSMCVRSNTWPAYQMGHGEGGTEIIEAPVSALMRLDEREASGEFRLSPDADETMKALWFEFNKPPAVSLGQVRRG